MKAKFNKICKKKAIHLQMDEYSYVDGTFLKT